MAVGVGGGGKILLDASTLLNLYATGRMNEILQVAGGCFAVVDYVAREEALYVRRGGSGPDANEREQVDLQPLHRNGLIEIVTLQGDAEAGRFIDFCAELDDGEAMTCAIAAVRGYSVATDDRKTIRVLGCQRPVVQAVRTMSLVKEWAERGRIPNEKVRTTLVAIRERARFAPPPDDPLRGWWRSILGD